MVSLRMQGRTSDGAMIRSTSVDNSASADHSRLIMAESPLICSKRKGSLCDHHPQLVQSALEGSLVLVNSRHFLNLHKDLPRIQREKKRDEVHHPLEFGAFP